MGRVAFLLVVGLAVAPAASGQELGPRWWRRPAEDTAVVGLGTGESLSRELAIDRARESALADVARQRLVRVRSEQTAFTRESVAADSGTVVRGSERIESATASATLGRLRERVATRRVSGGRWRAWVLLH